jgi:hypothetical protein
MPNGGYSFAGFGDYMNGAFDETGTDKDWFSLDIYYKDGQVAQAGGQVGGVKIRMDNGLGTPGNEDQGGTFRGLDSLSGNTVEGDFTCQEAEQSMVPTPFVAPTPGPPEPTRTANGVMTMLAGTVELPGTDRFNPSEVLLYGVNSHRVDSRAPIMGGGRYSFDSVTGPEPGAYQVLVDLETALLAVFAGNDCYDIGVPAGWGLYYLDGNDYVQAVGIVSYRGLEDYLFPGPPGATIHMPPVYAGSDPVALNYLDTAQVDLSLICMDRPS